MKNNRFITYLVALMILAVPVVDISAQTARQSTPTDPAELAKLRAAIEANPNDLAAHDAFYKASGFTRWGVPVDPMFVKQYEDWMKKFPTSPAIPYALGHVYTAKESPKAKPYLLKAVEIDPKFHQAYSDLWIDSERWGDFKQANEYLLQAKNAAPQNPNYAFYYATAAHDPEEYRKLTLEVAEKFPKTERGAQALLLLARRVEDPQEKIKYWEQLKRDFPVDKFSLSASAMMDYYSLMLTMDPQKALAIAEPMSGLKGQHEIIQKAWEDNIVIVKTVNEVKALLSAGKPTEAAVHMKKIPVPRYGYGSASEYILSLKSQVLAASGEDDEAYKNILRVFAKEPTQKLNTLLEQYGRKLRKDAATVKNDVLYIRDTAARSAPNFELENYYINKKTKLDDFKGKVVLLTYWFPGCGPCRGEFPHFENAIKKFKDRSDFAYVGINIEESQDDYVIPFMRSSQYSFIPLKDNDKWQKGALDNGGAAPVNFLIDGTGKIIFSRFRTDENNEETLELMIKSMIDRQKGA